jgi:HSP20 family protein
MVMANITRFSPLRELERFNPFQELEEMWKSMRMRPLTGAETSFGEIRLDVSESDLAYTVRADIPGVTKDDIKVSIDGNQVSIAAETRQEKEEHGWNTLRSERFYGQLYRSFTLESPIDEEKADAKYESGVLELTLPKKAGATAHQVKVH